MVSGALSHDQDLFSTKRSQPLSLGIALHYRSSPFAPSSIGSGWSHSYETSLQIAGNVVTLWLDGNRRIYILRNNAYDSPNGDFSSLVRNPDGTYTITEKDGLERNFNSSGVATSLVDRNNNVLSFTYTSGKLTSVTDANGRTATFGYIGNSLQTVTDPMGHQYVLAYVNGKLDTVTNPDTGFWKYTYGANGHLETKTDPENNQVTYAYTNNRLTSTTDPEDKTRSYSYPPVATAGKIPDAYPVASLPQKTFTFTEKDNGNWTYIFDTRTETIKSKTDPLGHATTFTYDKQGNMLTKTEPGLTTSLTTTYTYVAKGNVASVKDPLGQTTYYTYNAFSSVLTVTGAPGNTTNTYYANGNLWTVTDPTNAVTTYGYDGRGNLTSVTDPRLKVTTMTYDANNNLETVTLASGATTTFAYDGNGNVLSTVSALNTVTTYSYDTRNRLAGVTDPLNHTTLYTYDKNGNLKTVTDANQKTTTNTYNYLGQITSTQDALTRLTQLGYGTAGCPSCTGVDQLVSITDARNKRTSWTYDTVGRLQTETDPLTRATTYAYSALKSPDSKTDANNVQTTYTYDNLERLTRKSASDGTTNYGYDGRNNILSAYNGNVSYTMTYDGDNRIKTATDNTRGYVITYDYDPAGNRTKMTVQGGGDQRIFDYTYDNRNRLETLIASNGTFTFGYDPLDRRTSMTYPNGIATGYGYDDAGRLTSITGPASASFGYAYDNAGNRLTKTGTRSESYGYDDVYRLLQATLPEGIENFTYDEVGNRQSGPGPKDTGYQYNDANGMIQGRKIAYQYDYNGNQTTRTVPNAPDKTWVQTWDSENRLIRAEKTKGAERRTVTYTYDPFNRRIGKQLTTVIDNVTNASNWAYVYDNDSIVLEVYTAPTGSITKTWYTQGPGIDEHLAFERNGSNYYYHADGLGSIAAITDRDQYTVQSYTYDSFGLPTQTTDFVNSYAFTGREWDTHAGLYYYRARYYDPMEGRFISKDPIGIAGGDANLFAYVGNNPVNFVDPLGLKCSDPDIGQFGPLTNTLWHLGSNYFEMREANTTTPGTDKFFHCMAHCQAAKEGPVGIAISRFWGETWELLDEYIINPLKRIPKEKNKQDCNEDREANRCGREGDKNTLCKETCRSYKPKTWNPNYKGWQKYE